MPKAQHLDAPAHRTQSALPRLNRHERPSRKGIARATGGLLVLAGVMYGPCAMAQVSAGPAPNLTALYGVRTAITRQQYDYTGGDVVITAPANAVGVYIKAWGAGGGHEVLDNPSKAGAGGYTGAVFNTSAGTQYTLMVGGGGNRVERPDQGGAPSQAGVYGFGGLSMHDQGGGLSGVFSGAGAITNTSQARALVVAGGGGGSDDDGGDLRSGGTNGNGVQSGVPAGTTDGVLSWTYNTSDNTRAPNGGVAGTMQGSSDGWTTSPNPNPCGSLQWPANWQSGGGGGYQGGGRTTYTGNFTGVNQAFRCGVDAESSGRGGSGFVATSNRFESIESTPEVAATNDGVVNVVPRHGTDTDQSNITGQPRNQVPIGRAGNRSNFSFSTDVNGGGDGRIVVYWIVAAPTVSVQKVTTNAAGGPFSFADSNLTGSVPDIATTAANTATPAAPVALPVTTPGANVVLTETPAAGFYQTGVTCNDNNSALTGNTNPVATATTTAVTIPAAATAAKAADIVCVFTNVGGSDLGITKTNTPGVNGNVDQANDTVISGASNTYTIVITNHGPAAVSGAVVSDPAATRTGQTCSTAPDAVSCSGSVAGVCPSATTDFATLDSGYTLGNMPVNATATLIFTCTVD